jgi:predicted nucleotidyltransferase
MVSTWPLSKPDLTRSCCGPSATEFGLGFAQALAQEQAHSAHLRSRVVPLVQQALVDARGAALCGRVWLFGSYAWGEPTERSDVDLLAEDCPDPDRLAAVVARRTGTDVHVVPNEDAAETLRLRAHQEGVLL